MPIGFEKIVKRKFAMESESWRQDNQNLFVIAKNSVLENKSTLRSDVERFMEACKDKRNANKNYNLCLSIMEKVESSDNRLLSDYNLSVFTEEIMPYIEDQESLRDNVEWSKLSESAKQRILEESSMYKIYDRVISNSNLISKRFDIEKSISSNPNIPLEEMVFNCCSLIDTYDNIPSYGKMNIVIEQMSYYMQKNAVNYSREDFVSLVTEYFLLRQKEMSPVEVTKYKKVLRENKFISEEDKSKVRYFTESDFVDSNEVRKLIDDYKAKEIKDVGTLRYMISSIYTKKPEDIIDEAPSILSFLRIFIILGVFGVNPIASLIVFIADKYIAMEMTRTQINKVITAFNSEVAKVEKKMDFTEGDKYQELKEYKSSLEKSLEKLTDYRDDLYPDSKIEDDLGFKSLGESLELLTLHEFKIFKFHNLIRAALEVDKFLTRKNNKILDAVKKKSKVIFRATKKFFTEDALLTSNMITDDNNFDVCIAVYQANTDEDVFSLHNDIESLCGSMNSELCNNESYRVTYTQIGDRFEIHLEDAHYIIMEPEDKAILENSVSSQDLLNMSSILSTADAIEKVEGIDITTLIPDTLSLSDSMDVDTLSTVMELCSYTGLFTSKDIDSMTSSFNESSLDNTRINLAKYSWKPIYVPFEVQAEAMCLLRQTLNEGVNINDVKIAMAGMMKQVKDFGSKEKEMSRNLDFTVNHFVKSIEQALTTDRREAVIKGSVIPSFSKCIKIGLGLAGIAVIAGDPIIPIITAIAGLAMSKYLTSKERSLLLDEIDIELKAVEKELSVAESNNNMKKYRKLLTYQKKLQRERQRIRYNIKFGKDLPDSSVGTQER